MKVKIGSAKKKPKMENGGTTKKEEEIPNSGGSLTSSESFNNFQYWKDPIPGNSFNFTKKKVLTKKNNKLSNNKLWFYIFRAEIPISAMGEDSNHSVMSNSQDASEFTNIKGKVLFNWHENMNSSCFLPTFKFSN